MGGTPQGAGNLVIWLVYNKWRKIENIRAKTCNCPFIEKVLQLFFFIFSDVFELLSHEIFSRSVASNWLYNTAKSIMVFLIHFMVYNFLKLFDWCYLPITCNCFLRYIWKRKIYFLEKLPADYFSIFTLINH